ncbi:thiolase family protein [Paenibacillus sp. M1]|uniref:acetyl-CoA C-acetyltransferase n=1 Tax=Paenibacillus haidiansis TaxID=1574488 RepID=A0ABU7VRK6_9BACL
MLIITACRTPIGRTAGRLSKISDVRLLALAFSEAVRRIQKVDVAIDSVYAGCCFPQEDFNIARKAILRAGLPASIPAATINRTCCSSMEALVQGARQIMLGEAEVVLVGGVENMSNSPQVMKNAIRTARGLINGKLPTFEQISGDLIDEMGISTELLARRFGITRDEQDEYACLSHSRAADAQKKGYFKEEIFPVWDEETDGWFSEDETIISNLSKDVASKEATIFLSDGTLTKLNSSSINDAAAAMVLMSEKAALTYGVEPMGEYKCSGVVGVAPAEMGLAPAEVIQAMLNKSGLRMEEIDGIECNEAFAAQQLICQKKLGWSWDRVNVNGGALALGHPLGCTGIRICTTLLYTMKRNKWNRGIAAMCAGGGMGQGILFEAWN